MNSSEKDEEDKSRETLRTKITTTISIGDSDSSLSLSLTPPSLDEGKNDEKNKEKAIVSENSQDSISEHLSSIATSIENDRSLHEIEIDNIPALSLDDCDFSERENERLSQEAKPNLMSTSPNSDSNSVTSLAGAERAEVKSIVEDIVNNKKFVHDSENLSMKSEEDRFDIFGDLDLDDRSLTQRIMNQVNNENCDSNMNNVVKQVKDLEEMIEDKNQAIIALSTELDSLREMVSNPSTMSIGSPTEYKQLHEEYHNKVVEYHGAIEQKDKLILQLTESLQQSIANREDLKAQVEHFKKEVEFLQEKLGNPIETQLENESINEIPEVKVTESVDKVNYSPSMDSKSSDFETEYLQLQRMLNADQLKMLAKFNNTINKYIEHKLNENEKENEEVISNLKKTIEEERSVHDKEVERLRELLGNMKCGSVEIMEMRQELEVIHQKETEDLRMYFEKKCADLEKNYAEEVFSQHSRKRSESSTSSDNELISDIAGIQRKPGPGGDAPSSLENYKVDYKKRALQHLKKSDLVNLKQDLSNILNIFNKFEIGSSSEENLGKLKEDLGNYDVQNLFRIEMEAFKNEMKNKYNAELEILNQDYENKVDLLMVQQEEKLNAMKAKYLEEIENLKDILNKSNKAIVYSSAVQEVGSGDFEINEVVQSYERRLQEQVTMAKIDIIAALESQIQRLAANEGEDEEWPQELLTLRDRFTERFEKKIAVMEDEHKCEIAKLKEEHIKNLNGALERARRRSLKDGENMTSFDTKVIGERDNFKKQAGLLRQLLGELLKYFTQCEDEVNNTIVDELVRQANEKNFTDIERELNDSTSSSKTGSTSSSAAASVKRVHLAPNFSELMSILENSSGRDSESMEFSTDLKNELESCLEKLRAEANAVLALSLNVSKKPEGERVENHADEQSLSTLNRKLIEEVQMRMKISEELEEKSGIIESLERERTVLEAHVLELIERLNVTQTELGKSQIKISELLESGQHEDVSEGYGGMTFGGRHEEGHAVETFNQLQEKARTLLVGSHSGDTDLLQLLEELVNTGERIIEETKSERRDLEQQAELLETQLKESTQLLDAKDRKLKEIESEKDEAVEKIYFLRDVIRDLESQVKVKADTEAELRNLISELELLISKQNRGIQESLERSQLSADDAEPERLREHLRDLEAEVQRLRVSQELVGTEGALREVRNQLIDIETTIDRKTKELEEQSSIVSTTTCSSPSEDMSVRDVVRPKTPTSLAVNECEIPLQQLARLKEKLIRHARAEDAALKRIRDLEMQVFTLKAALEENSTEKDILKKEISDQLVLISSLQIRLDDQRIRAEHIEKQTNSSLESRIYDLQKEISELEEHLDNRNKTIAHLNAQVDEMRNKIEDKETEYCSTSEDEMIVTMQKEIEHLRNQNELLHKRLTSGADLIPNLVENIISDKNSDIESLKQKLNSVEKQLDVYSSLNLDSSQISTLKNLKNSGTSLSEVLSIIEFSTPDQPRRIADSSRDDNFGEQSFLRKNPKDRNDTAPFLSTDDVREISSIEKIGPASNHFSSLTPFGK
ncbi:hypothetical protein WA026_001367 [Henosepilachna vigintioctopunctata]|uniref:Uncharacterized protein n=1 Tax=Henosepilachna vigintioctopunctata TaxID=420089 RepID=A0AAW1UPP8_9CUCU